MNDDEASHGDEDAEPAYEAAAARGESRSSSGALTGCLVLVAGVVLLAFLYFGLFAAILGEEFFVGSGWFRENLPRPVLEFLQAIYWPLLWLMDQFDG